MGDKEKLPPHVDNSIASIIFSMIGEPSVEACLQYELELVKKSLVDMHAQLEASQLKCQLVSQKHAKAREEASMSATALKETICELDALRASHEQLRRECELYQNDRQIFAEAAEDAEERRANADQKADEAEERAIEAERRERAALCYIEDLIKDSGKFQIASPHQNGKDRQQIPKEDFDPNCHNNTQEADSLHVPLVGKRSNPITKLVGDNNCLTKTDRRNSPIAKARLTESTSTLSNFLKETRGAKRVLFDAMKAHERNSPPTRRRISKCSPSSSIKSEGDGSKIARASQDEKENKLTEVNTTSQIEQGALSDNVTIRYLAERLKILKANLVKAESEGELIHAKYCEVQKLLMDTLATFGVLPEGKRQVVNNGWTERTADDMG